MKKSLLIIGSLIISSIAAQAQDSVKVATPNSFPIVELGIRFMPTVSNFDMKSSSGGTVTGEATFGYGIGAVLGINFTKHVGIQGELLYNSLSQKYKDQNLNREINVNYINIPVLLSLNTDKSKTVNLNFVVGPQFGINVGSSFSSTGGGGAADTLTTVLATKQSDFGLAYGLGLGIMLNDKHTIRFDIGYRGIYGLVNISNTGQTSSNNSVNILDRANVRTNSAYLGFSLLF